MISSDTHWTTSSSPYVVTSSILVVNDARLTIDPGVEVRLDPGSRLEIGSGTLLARGTPANLIRFTANVDGTVADSDRWDRIQFSDGAVDAEYDAAGNYVAGSAIQYAIVEYAGWYAYRSADLTMVYADSEGAVRAESSSPLVQNCSIVHNAGGGVAVVASDNARIIGNALSDNYPSPAVVAENAYLGYGAALYISESNGVLISDNTVTENLAGSVDGSSGVNRGTIYVKDSSSIQFGGNVVQGNTSHTGTVYLDSSSGVTITGDHIIENEGTGLYATGASNLALLSSDPNVPTWLYGNSDYQAYNDMAFTGSFSPTGIGNIDARGVWWNTTDSAAISNGIYDYVDSTGRGLVFYSPCAPAAPEPAAVALLALGGLAVLRRRKRLHRPLAA
jgi:MYXO-CTERM domain-containing protein